MDKFWKVQGEGLAFSVKRFNNIEEAKVEAVRMARQHPGTHIVVLASLGDYTVQDITWSPHSLAEEIND